MAIDEPIRLYNRWKRQVPRRGNRAIAEGAKLAMLLTVLMLTAALCVASAVLITRWAIGG